MPKPQRSGRPSGEPKYRLIAEDITRRIIEGEWASGTRIPTSRKLQATYGVAKMTLLHALQVVKQQGLLRFGPRQHPIVDRAAPLSAIFDGTIVLVLSRPLEYILRYDLNWRGAICRGIVQSTADTSWPLLTLQGNRWRKEFPAALCNLPVQGVVLVACPFKTEVLKQYEAFKCPVVLLDQPPTGLALHSISVDNRKAAFDAVSRLIALRHRQIAFLRAIQYPVNDANVYTLMSADDAERAKAFEAACKKAGFTRSQYRVYTMYLDESLKKVLDSKPPFTAIIAADPGIAARMETQAAAAKLKVPRDFSLVTFHYSSPTGRNWSGPRIDFSEFGRRAVALLKRKPQTQQEIRMPAVWHDGDTMQSPQAKAPARKPLR